MSDWNFEVSFTIDPMTYGKLKAKAGKRGIEPEKYAQRVVRKTVELESELIEQI